MSDPARGKVWLIDLGLGEGHEQAGKRPALIVSVDQFNRGLSDLVMVLPITSQTAKSRNIPAHILVTPPEGGLKVPSIVMGDQLRTISKNRLLTCWGNISTKTMIDIETVLRFLLGL
jgi:mRNA interferase MazF